ncbi:GntR family transcriptional regulator [Phytohabitans suffuscus]
MTAPPTLTIDTASPVPPYEQIRAQLAQLIQHQVLAPGDRLPPVRQLAGDLGLAVGTVARAYRELELSGQVRSRRGGGTTVAATAAKSTPAERSHLLATHAATYVAQARQLGFDDDGLLAAVRRAAGPETGTA